MWFLVKHLVIFVFFSLVGSWITFHNNTLHYWIFSHTQSCISRYLVSSELAQKTWQNPHTLKENLKEHMQKIRHWVKNRL